MGSRYQIPKKNWKELEDYFGKEEFKKFLRGVEVGKMYSAKKPFTKFHKSWSKNNVLSIWKGNTWEQVIDFCNVANIKPKEVMGWLAARKIDHTNWKTMRIAALCKEKLEAESKKKKPRTTRSVILGLSSQVSNIDDNLELASDDKIYKTCWNALKRTKS